MKKKDLFLGGGILFAACVLFLVMNLMQYVQAKENGQKENQEKQVVIKVDGEVYGRYALDEDQVIEVQEGDFYNRIRIEDGKAYMEEADCPDGYCEEQGKINNRTQTIVCLPHKLVVEIEEVENSDDSSKWEFLKWQYSLNHLGKEIHMCMEGYCSAYIYWYLKRFYGLMGDTDKRSPTSEGEITKNGYIMAHYAQYATETTRIKVVTNNEEVCATAYLDEKTGEVTIVLLNLNGASQWLEIPLAGIKKASAVETNETKNMEVIDTGLMESAEGITVLLSANSITSVRLTF